MEPLSALGAHELKQPSETGTIFLSTLQLRKWMHREAEQRVEHHTAAE